MNSNILISLILIIVSVNFVHSESKCNNFETCGGCIGYPYEKCVWCSAADQKDRRCQSEIFSDANKAWCKDPVYNPQTLVTVTENKPLSSGANGTNVVQFIPQKMTIKMRPGVAVNITMFYKPAKDYPLDVYYLMDYSYTMSAHKKVLQSQGKEIYQQLSMITNNVHLGVGSFVEKPGLPYAGPTHKAYSFKNHLSLNNDMKLFAEAITDSVTGANLDDPEASLDALMQAMVCEKEVGWREKARRIIVLCTDAPYHSAGDGKMVGAYKPNDMKCHLDENGTYTEALSLDYPSVSQINKIATELNIKIFFAAVENVRREYEALEKRVQGSKYAVLKRKSNIVEMIKNEYLTLLGNLEIKREVPKYIQLTLDPESSKVPHHEPVKIVSTLKIKSCPSDSRKTDFVKIGPMGLNEHLLITIDIDCECDCEKPGSGKLNSPACSGHGTYQCGICKCNENRYGNDCRCIGSSTDLVNIDKCKANKNDTKLCSGRATCRCGKCENCPVGYSGDFCEFDDNNDCPKPGNILCAGRGKCRYGRCECDEHWIGDCRCPDHERSCIAPSSKEVCSGNGKCVCGECVCNKLEAQNETYYGAYCDFCEECAEKRCKELEDYVHCVYMNNQTVCDQKYNQTSDIDVIMANETEINAPDYHLAKWCIEQLDDGSAIIFKFGYSTNRLLLVIQKEPKLPPKANILVAVGSAIGVILLIGLLTVVAWKILVDIHDAREYKKFSEESAAAGFDISMNPLYQPPAVNFSNPVYNGRS